MGRSSIEVVLHLRNTNAFNRDAQSASRSIDRVGDSGKRAGKGLDQTSRSSRAAHRSMGALATAAKTGAFALGGFSVIAGKRSVEAAVNLGEQVNKTKVVFRGSEQGILSWSKTTAGAFGISRREALESAGVFGNMLVPMGVARDRAGGMSKRMVELAADMASFNNASPAETLESIRSGLAGESEPLRKYGVFLSDARLKHEAMSKGLYKGKGQLDAHAKALATYSLLFKDTKDAQGDFGRTSTSLANQQRILKAEFENVGARLGKHLLPVLTKGAVATSKFLDQMEKGRGPGGQFAKTTGSIWKSVKPMALWLGRAAVKVGKFAGEHPNLVKFAAGFLAIRLAMRKVSGPGVFGSAGRRGSGAFIGGFKGGMGSYFGGKFAEWFLGRYGGRFKAAGTRVGTTMGRSAGTSAATTAGGEMAASARGGRLRGGFAAAGRMVGPVMGGIVAAEVLSMLGTRLQEWGAKYGKSHPGKFGTLVERGTGVLGGGALNAPSRALGKGDLFPKLFAQGGSISAGRMGIVGDRGPELAVAGSSGTRIMPISGSRVPQLQGAVAASGAGGGGDVVIQHRTYLDSRVLYESHERHARAKAARR